MNIQEQMQQDVKAAMRSGDRMRVDVLRMALASLKNAEMVLIKEAFDAAKPAEGEGEIAPIVVTLSEAAMQQTITKEVKRRYDAAELYTKGGRADLAQQEEAEAAILETYLPRQLTADELRPMLVEAIGQLGATSIADMGKVMPALIQQFKDRADGRLISQLAREILSTPRV
ncbi:MAG TPA: GatB/YqeY domain-containing protein [Kouleothrix sp.]|nr:GatB/YqeY domain-containing protein [Kouleothrix sp.]